MFYQNRDEEYTARVTVNNTYPAHLHRQTELIYVTKGHIEITIDDKSCTLEAGSLSVCFPGHSHSTRSIDDSSAILIIFNPEFAHGYLTELMHRSPGMPFLAKSQLPLEVTLAIKSLSECYASRKDSRIAQGYISIILGNILPMLELHDTSDSTDACRQIIEYIAGHFLGEITLDSMAHALGLSKYYISHIFTEQIRSSFPAYLGKCRAEHAARLLKTSSMTVTEIGYASGFNSSRTFYRTFRDVYNMTPQEFRKQ